MQLLLERTEPPRWDWGPRGTAHPTGEVLRGKIPEEAENPGNLLEPNNHLNLQMWEICRDEVEVTAREEFDSKFYLKGPKNEEPSPRFQGGLPRDYSVKIPPKASRGRMLDNKWTFETNFRDEILKDEKNLWRILIEKNSWSQASRRNSEEITNVWWISLKGQTSEQMLARSIERITIRLHRELPRRTNLRK